jgi:hypothetical protein
VCGWAAQGIPFKIVCQGIDACFVATTQKAHAGVPCRSISAENDIPERSTHGDAPWVCGCRAITLAVRKQKASGAGGVCRNTSIVCASG